MSTHTSLRAPRARLHPLGRAVRTALAGSLLALVAGSSMAQSIGALQGTAHLSTFAGMSVSNITGIVTAVASNGFWIQDGGDGNALTSDALFVFRGSSSKPVIGQAVQVTGQLQEFRPGGDATNLTLTQINATVSGGLFTVLSSGNALPAAVVIDTGFLPPSAIAPAVGNVETSPGYALQPTLYSMDFYESLEGMRVTMPSAVSSGPRNSFGEVTLVPTAALSQPGVLQASRGGVVIGPSQFNGTRLQIDDRLAATPIVNSGAVLSNVTGVMDYSFNNYELLVTSTPTVVSNSLTAEVATIPSGHFGIASYNVENLGGTAAPARFTAIAGQIATNLGAPHLISLQEVQDNNGATNNGVVAADVTLNTLATALNTATGRNYAWVTVNGVNNADGGEPGGNIRQAFMYDTSRVSFSGVVGGALDAVTAIAGAGGQIELNLGAGRIDPTNPAFANSRKPLVTQFTADGQQLIVIANHFNSKGGDQPLYGPTQPPVRSTETQRLAQAQAVADFVEELLAINPNANIIVTGDLNDFQFAGSLAPLAAAGLVNLTDSLPENERYTYAFEGNLQALDHMWVSSNLLAAGALYDIVHANAEFITQVSDHDPVLMTLGMVPSPVPEPATWLMMALGMAGLVARARR